MSSERITDKLPEISFSVAGVDGLMMQFGNTMSPELPGFLQQFREHILKASEGAVKEVIPAYNTILVYYDPLSVRTYELEIWLEQQARELPVQPATKSGRLIEIPVCYGGEYGPDLARIAEAKNCSEDDVIAAHTGTEYQVYALGFAPGFAYLGSVPESIAMPRLKTPRKHVAAGSVGIADQQTAVYPTESPGGWNIIGRSPVRWFDVDNDPMTPVQCGDRVRFRAISAKEMQS